MVVVFVLEWLSTSSFYFYLKNNNTFLMGGKTELPKSAGMNYQERREKKIRPFLSVKGAI